LRKCGARTYSTGGAASCSVCPVSAGREFSDAKGATSLASCYKPTTTITTSSDYEVRVPVRGAGGQQLDGFCRSGEYTIAHASYKSFKSKCGLSGSSVVNASGLALPLAPGASYEVRRAGAWTPALQARTVSGPTIANGAISVTYRPTI